MTPPVPFRAPTRGEIEEAIHGHIADARKARERGNELRVAERHRQVNELLTLWELECEPVPA